MPDITLEEANRLIAQGIAAAEEAGVKAAVAAYDGGANIVAFARMDGAPIGCNEFACAKARTSALFGVPSDALAAPIEVGKPPARLDNVHTPALLLIPGGLPIADSTGAPIGAIGVSGGTPEQDAAVANAALDT